MKKQVKVDGRISEVKLMNNPIVVRVNKFNEDAAKKFTQDMASAHNSGQNIIPIVIDSYGGQVYSLMSMISDITIQISSFWVSHLRVHPQHMFRLLLSQNQIYTRISNNFSNIFFSESLRLTKEIICQ